MTIHIFNPDHDIALAMNQSNFTPPHAGRQLRSDLGFLPALWARKGDFVLVDDVAAAQNAYRKLKLVRRTEVNFVELGDLKGLSERYKRIDIQPWGWNKTLWTTLQKAGIPVEVMPSKIAIETIRDLSNRRLAVKLLDQLKDIPGVTGFSRVCNTYEEVLVFLDNNKDIVVKAPWSSSGRGVKYMERELVDENALQWIANTIQKQHSVVAEMKCHKLHDFAIEFMSERNGKVKACGISLFTTERGAYTGNILDGEKAKLQLLHSYIAPELLADIIARIEKFLSEHINGVYVGPLGVDMMVVANNARRSDNQPAYLLNPCVEINLRRTMGHVAMALGKRGQRGTMAIEYAAKSYKLKLINNNN